MQDFVIPVKPEGLLRSHEEHCYTIEEEISISSLSQKDLSGILNGIRHYSLHLNFPPTLPPLGIELRLASEPSDIVEHEAFDSLFAFLR